jgi:hypothetical protein
VPHHVAQDEDAAAGVGEHRLDVARLVRVEDAVPEDGVAVVRQAPELGDEVEGAADRAARQSRGAELLEPVDVPGVAPARGRHLAGQVLPLSLLTMSW